MTLGFRFFRIVMLIFCANSVSLLGALAQQKTDAGSGIQEGAMSPSDFELKIKGGDFFVRQKGTLKWRRSSEVSEPVAVGLLDGRRKVYVITKAIKPPKAKHTSDPDYPESERRRKMEGYVSLHVIVDDQGLVRLPTVDVSPGPEFSESAIEAVRKWTFEPARLDGQPVAFLINVTMKFNLY